MAQAIDEADDAGGVGEDLGPFVEDAVGGDDGRAPLIALADHLKQQVGVTLPIGHVSDLIENKQGRRGVVAQASTQVGGAILGGEVPEHVGGGDEASSVAREDGTMGEVLGEHGLADAAGADEDDVDMLAEEVEVEEGLDRVAVDLPGMRPVEVGDRLEGAKRRVGDPTLEAATAALGLGNSKTNSF